MSKIFSTKDDILTLPGEAFKEAKEGDYGPGEALLAKRAEEETKEAAKQPAKPQGRFEEPLTLPPRALPAMFEWKRGDKFKLFEDFHQIVGLEVIRTHPRGRFMVRLIQKVK